MFKLNDKVVYPGHGVANVESIIKKKVVGNEIAFFKLAFIYKDMTILVPIHNLENTGVRHLSDEKTIDKALNELYNQPEKNVEQLDLSPSGWNKRNKEYQLQIQSGKVIEIAKIYRDLMHISLQKELSFGEKHLLSTIEELLVQEIVVVRKKEKSEVLRELRNPFKHFVVNKSDQSQQISSL
jgi:CarD family transcriptional regulator